VRVPDDIVIHEGTPDADQVQADVVEIEKLLDMPFADAETVAGDTVKLHVPRCVTAYVRPAIVTFPVRCEVPV
jgi:hypothetical protein